MADMLAGRFPDARTLDIVLTPMPVNPVCREVIAVQRAAGRYVLRRAFHSLAPGWIPAERCARSYPLGDGGPTTARLAAVALPSTAEVAWIGELAVPAGRLPGLAAEYCAVDALLRFARASWAVPRGDGWVAGDLRYDRGEGPDLGEVEVGPGRDGCPRLPAPWTPPREDLLRGSSSGFDRVININ